MPIANLDPFDPRQFDGVGGLGLGHAAGAQLPAGTGRSPAELMAKYADKIDELIDGVNALPLASATLASPTELTIATGAITITKNNHTVDTEADAASDSLDTITGGSAGSLLFLSPADGARSIVVKHLTDNIVNPAGEDITLAEVTDFVLLVKKGAFWVVLTHMTLASAGGGLGVALASTAASKGASLVAVRDAADLLAGANVEAVILELAGRAQIALTDPGTGAAIPVTRSAIVSITTTGAGQTNTLAIPTFLGQRLTLCHDVDGGGNRVVTVASPVSGTDNTLTFADAGDFIELIAIKVAGVLCWRIVVNSGVALSTV